MAATLSLTEQLCSFADGDRDVAETVLREVLPKLHEIAVRQLKQERYQAPLQATELIHEAWLRSIGGAGWRVESREHFYAIASLAMRRVLVDYARRRLAERRGYGLACEAIEDHAADLRSTGPSAESIVEVGMLLERLEKADPEAARIVDMHYFAGFTLQEIAQLTGLSFRQVRHRWEKGRDWLKDRMQ